MKYRKKPVVIDAVSVRETIEGAMSWSNLEPWVIDAYEEGLLLFLPNAIEIRTLEGTMRGELGDWLIKGIQGELYPCKPDIFEATYERIFENRTCVCLMITTEDRRPPQRSNDPSCPLHGVTALAG